MDDSSGIRSILFQGKNSRHDIVAPYTFFSSNDLECLITHNKVRPDCLDGFIGDLSEAQLPLGLGKPEPELSPCRSPFSRRKYFLYLAAWIVGLADLLFRSGGFFLVFFSLLNGLFVRKLTRITMS